MNQQIFSDGIGQITIVAGAVRLDFVTYSPTEKDAKGQPVAVFSHRVVMSMEGFMQSAVKLQEAAQTASKLVQRVRDGQPADPAATAIPAAVAETAAVPQKRPFP
jgi:hypothetical protein